MLMLVDSITITIKAGNGGNGAATFRHTAQTFKGGPDGGNGGNGGAIYFQGVNDISALQQFRFKKHLQGENGVAGARKNLFGRNGKDIIIPVPIGTQITEANTKKTYDITDTSTKILLAKGGIGGRGNNEFKTATNQAPRYAEKGTPGEEKELVLEMRLIADIGLIGLPNAGKSSLLAELTNANPKIANYPFTTLEPNLGVMKGILLADIPGLIEGASKGKGLGIQFLRHVEKTKLLLHCIACDSEDVLATYQTIKNELSSYSKALVEKPEIILLTKSDLLTPTELKNKITSLKKISQHILTTSIYDEDSVKKLSALLTEALLISVIPSD